MFYCNVCAMKRNYPMTFNTSLGTCEICGNKADCNDISSRDLPPIISENTEVKPKINFDCGADTGICQMKNERTAYVLDGREVDVKTYAFAITARLQKLIKGLQDIKT